MVALSSRRAFVVSAAAAMTTACGISPVLKNSYEAARFLIVGQPDVPITRDRINQIPYATISAKIGKGPRSILVLYWIRGTDLHWLSADRATIVTRDGRVVKTAGFPDNMIDTRFSDRDPVARVLHRPDHPTELTRTVDFDQGNMFGIPIMSQFITLGPTRITIAELEVETVLVREANTTREGFSWSFENLYWVDAVDGFVWKSRQYISRNFPPVDIEVLKPASV
jgi:hypothetical protein